MNLKSSALIGVFMSAICLTLNANAVPVGVQIILDSSLTASQTESQLRSAIDSWISETNTYYSGSGVDIQLYTTNVDIRNFTNNQTQLNSNTILANMRNQVGVFSGLATQSDKIGSDYVVAISPNGLTDGTRSLCGQAASVASSLVEIGNLNNSFAVSNFACGAETFAHELGHLMGLNHGNKVAECTGDSGHTVGGIEAFSRGFGFGVCGSTSGFGDIMAGNYLRPFVKIPFFSNPRLQNPTLCVGTSGNKCGDEINGDSSRSLQLYKDTYAKRQYPDVDNLSFKDSNFKTCAAKYSNIEPYELTQLDCANFGIRDTSGLEQLTNLNNILLGNNKIFRVAALGNLNNATLQQIDLTGNLSVDCNELAFLMQKYPGKVMTPKSCFSSVIVPANLGFILL